MRERGREIEVEGGERYMESWRAEREMRMNKGRKEREKGKKEGRCG